MRRSSAPASVIVAAIALITLVPADLASLKGRPPADPREARLGVATLTGRPAEAQTAAPRAPQHGVAPRRLLIRNATVIYGNARPAFGPVDVVVEDGLIARVGSEWPGASSAVQPDAIIDAGGKYVMPGIVNTHMHLQEERGGLPQPLQYQLNLYLAAGATTIRDVATGLVGSDVSVERGREIRALSTAGRLVSPRVLLYGFVDGTRDAARQRAYIRELKQAGVDGLKLLGLDRDQLAVVLDEARRQLLPTTAHIGVEETTAKDYAELGVNGIEHFYGVADAALDGIQDFPPDMNYTNEIHRFGRAGELYIQKNLNREKLSAVLDLMVKKNVAWSPTLSIYVASRDLLKAQNLPWYREYLHPAMEYFWTPSLDNHGSYFIGWTNTQEVRWKHNYRVWMDALREFGIKGGVITTGDDAGFIYSLYGFGLVQELELQEEAGFHPLEVIKHATVNGAKAIGMEDRLGRVRQGYLADLLVVNGNPLENLHVLNPYGTGMNVSNRNVHGGGIEWTIKGGIPYHVPTLMKDVRDMVARARAQRSRPTPNP